MPDPTPRPWHNDVDWIYDNEGQRLFVATLGAWHGDQEAANAAYAVAAVNAHDDLMMTLMSVASWWDSNYESPDDLLASFEHFEAVIRPAITAAIAKGVVR